MDDVLESEPPWLEILLELFENLEVLYVGVQCPLVELERREKERKNRRDGLARLQFEQVHSKAIYDIEFDTSVLSLQECAALILKHIKPVSQPLAFYQLVEKHLRDCQYE